MRLEGKTQEAVKLTWKRKGVKHMPQWARLPYFDWAEDMLIDYMHICKNNGQRVRQMLADTNVDMGKLKRLVRKWSPVPGMRAVSCLPFCKPRFSLLGPHDTRRVYNVDGSGPLMVRQLAHGTLVSICYWVKGPSTFLSRPYGAIHPLDRPRYLFTSPSRVVQVLRGAETLTPASLLESHESLRRCTETCVPKLLPDGNFK